MPYTCTACARVIEFSAYVKSRRNLPTADRCPRCGCVHAVLNLSVERISPPMLPIGMTTRLSPWQLPRYRPIVAGDYELMFRHTGERVITLRWCGDHFEHDGRKVSMSQLLKWRGSWGEL